jgi:hypothetical protein
MQGFTCFVYYVHLFGVCPSILMYQSFFYHSTNHLAVLFFSIFCSLYPFNSRHPRSYPTPTSNHHRTTKSCTTKMCFNSGISDPSIPMSIMSISSDGYGHFIKPLTSKCCEGVCWVLVHVVYVLWLQTVYSVLVVLDDVHWREFVWSHWVSRSFTWNMENVSVEVRGGRVAQRVWHVWLTGLKPMSVRGEGLIPACGTRYVATYKRDFRRGSRIGGFLRFPPPSKGFYSPNVLGRRDSVAAMLSLGRVARISQENLWRKMLHKKKLSVKQHLLHNLCNLSGAIG